MLFYDLQTCKDNLLTIVIQSQRRREVQIEFGPNPEESNIKNENGAGSP